MKRKMRVSLGILSLTLVYSLAVAGHGRTAQDQAPGQIPLDFPAVDTSAKINEYVLAPSRAFIDRAYKDGIDRANFIFYAATVIEPGETESRLKVLSGSEAAIPNSLIVPLKHGATAEKGDVVLTWWQSGSGMKRGYVVEAKDPQRPVVRYIDIALDNPAKSKGVPLGELEEELKPNTFVKLTVEWEPGTTVAAADGGKFKKIQVIRVEGDKVLGLGFAGRMGVFEKAKCIPVPLFPEVKEGDNVMIPYSGTFRDGKVEKVDKKIGRVFVEFQFGGKPKVEAVPFGDVAKSLAF